MRISGWSSDVCSSDLLSEPNIGGQRCQGERAGKIKISAQCDMIKIATTAQILNAETPVGRPRRLGRECQGQHSGRRSTGNRGIIADQLRSEEHTSELQSLMRISYAVFCLKKKKTQTTTTTTTRKITNIT